MGRTDVLVSYICILMIIASVAAITSVAPILLEGAQESNLNLMDCATFIVCAAMVLVIGSAYAINNGKRPYWYLALVLSAVLLLITLILLINGFYIVTSSVFVISCSLIIVMLFTRPVRQHCSVFITAGNKDE